MHTQYYKEYSHILGRDMEFKVYGHAGLPFILFPCQDGKFFDYESRGLIDTVADKIENGQIQLFSVGCVDEETWSAKWGDHHGRIMWHEQWMKYICEEFLPRLHEIHAETDPMDYHGKSGWRMPLPFSLKHRQHLLLCSGFVFLYCGNRCRQN